MQKRAVNSALLGFATQILCIVAAIAARAYAVSEGGSPLLGPSGTFSFIMLGIVLWAGVLVASVLRRASVVESFELDVAARGGSAASTIFESELDARPAGRRLERFWRIGLPIFAGFIGASLVLMGLNLFNSVSRSAFVPFDEAYAGTAAGVSAGGAFFGFLVGRYLIGMAESERAPAGWTILRGGGSFLVGSALLLFLIAVSAGAIAIGTDLPQQIVRWIIPGVLLVVGVEMLLNVVLDLYRPVSAEAGTRAPFDSRLLQLLGAPGGLIQSFNQTINYQFGFELTQSYFWKLLSRSMAWLVLFAIASLVLLSCIVVVEPHQRALVVTFGGVSEKPLTPRAMPYFKMPWPLASVQRYDVERINDLNIGTHGQRAGDQHDFYLWTQQHEGSDRLLITGVDNRRPANQNAADASATNTSAPSVSLAAMDVLVHWRIDREKLLDFATRYSEPDARLRMAAESVLLREMLRYDVDQAIGGGRVELSEAVADELRRVVEDEQMGVEILWVGVAGAMPPRDTAESFNDKIAALQSQRQEEVLGEAQAAVALIGVAGSRDVADQLITEIRRYNQLRDDNAGEQDVEEQALVIETLLRSAGGQAADLIVLARGDRWVAENEARGQTTIIPALFEAYQNTPNFTRTRLSLEGMSEAMQAKPKHIYITDREIILDFDTKGGSTIGSMDSLNIPQ